MESTDATLVTIIVGFEYEARIIESLTKLGARGYTCWEVKGKGLHGPRESSVWDGTNLQFEVIVPPEIADKLLEHLDAEYLPDAPLKAYTHPVRAIPAGKFG